MTISEPAASKSVASRRRDIIGSWALLAAISILQIGWRWHTFGDTQLYRPLIELGTAAGGTVEPLDCDEAIYAYMGRRMLEGERLYRDLSENKPPLGYWLYGGAVALGGPNEWTIRLMPIPFVLATTLLVWWIGRETSGDRAGLLGAFVFALMSTDPYLFGNGANLEHAMNFFATLSLAAFLRGLKRNSRAWLFAAGAAIGCAASIKQTAVLPLGIYLVLALGSQPGSKADRRPRLVRFSSIALGFAAVWAVTLLVLAAQGVLVSGLDHFVVWASALARETPPDPGAPPGWIRWLVGNADPRGALPWPFGSTDYLVWWGTGSWPLWLLLPLLLVNALRPHPRATERRIAGGFLAATCVEVVMSGLYWQHYYLLPLPGLALMFAIACGDVAAAIRTRSWRRMFARFAAVVLILAVGWTIRIQVRDYLLMTPEQITSKLKGGAQWVALRTIARDLDRIVGRAGIDRSMYVWGWQSPLYFYGRFDSPTEYAFVDPLLKAKAASDHPLVRPRLREILADLDAKPPSLILAADPPFPALLQFLRDRYVISYAGFFPFLPDGRGLWIRRDALESFEAARGWPLPGR